MDLTLAVCELYCFLSISVDSKEIIKKIKRSQCASLYTTESNKLVEKKQCVGLDNKIWLKNRFVGVGGIGQKKKLNQTTVGIWSNVLRDWSKSFMGLVRSSCRSGCDQKPFGRRQEWDYKMELGWEWEWD